MSDLLTDRPLVKPLAAAGTAAVLLLGTAACGGDEAGDTGTATGGDAAEAFEFDGPINIVVPFAAGGSADQTARTLAAEAQDTCGTNVVVRNQTGGAGAVGFQAVADAAPDGQTVGVAAIELSILQHLGVAEITPADVRGIMQYSLQPVSYAVPADSPLQTIDDVIEQARAGGVTVATSGTGSIYHIGFAGMAEEAGVSDGMTNVPFDGAATALQAVLGGQTDMVSAGAGEIKRYVDSGDLRAIAVASEEPAEALPDVPTLTSEGIDWTSGAILGLIAPAGTPDEAITALNECFNAARESDAFTEFMASQGFTMEYKDAAEFDEFLSSEFDRYGEVVAATGIANQS